MLLTSLCDSRNGANSCPSNQHVHLETRLNSVDLTSGDLRDYRSFQFNIACHLNRRDPCYTDYRLFNIALLRRVIWRRLWCGMIFQCCPDI